MAKACYKTQSTITAQIQNAELEIGYAIFDRKKGHHRSGLVPTKKGKVFIKRAQKVVAEFEKLMLLKTKS